MYDTGNRNGEKISVVVQGAVETAVYERVSRSIREFLPGAEIILSTWEGTDLKGLDYDKAVINKDPGAFWSLYRGSQKKVRNNINRQIISTISGVKAAERKYVMKLRSDSVITGCGFLEYADRFLSPGKYLCFEPRNPWGKFKGEYCLCDFWFFGRRETIFKLWNIPLYEQNKNDRFDLLAEQYLIKCSDVPAEYSCSDEMKYLYLLKNQAVIIPTMKSGIQSLKYPGLNGIGDVKLRHYVVSHEDWKRINGMATVRDQIVCAISRLSGKIVLWVRKRMGK